MTNHHGALLAGECFQDVVGKALCSHAYDVLVHAVGTGTHDATQATRSELQVAIERVDELRLVLIVKHGLYSLACLFVESRRQPLLRSRLTLGDQLCIVVHKYKLKC